MMSFTSMKLLVLPMTAVLIISLTACGTSEEKQYAYRNAESIKPIEVPPDLEMAHSKESLQIPEQTATKLASIEELEKPPTIIESVDLKILDDNNDKAAKSEKSSDEKSAKLSSTGESLVIITSKNDEGNSLLLVDGEFEQIFPLVKPALLELGFKIDDASKGGQLYAISRVLPSMDTSGKPVHPGDEEPDVKEEFQIHVKPSGEKTQITVHNKLGAIEGSGLADHLLQQIKDIMEKPKNAPKSNS